LSATFAATILLPARIHLTSNGCAIARCCITPPADAITQGANYFGAAHDDGEGGAQPRSVEFYWANYAGYGVLHYGNWSEETEDVLEGRSCGFELQGIEEKQIRVKEAAQACRARLLPANCPQSCVTTARCSAFARSARLHARE
jgi:hypothetical protein